MDDWLDKHPRIDGALISLYFQPISNVKSFINYLRAWKPKKGEIVCLCNYEHVPVLYRKGWDVYVPGDPNPRTFDLENCVERIEAGHVHLEVRPEDAVLQ